jgi:hypothetical protein
MRQCNKRGHEVAGRVLHVMTLLQGIRKLFGLMMDELDCVSAVKDKQTSRKNFFANFLIVNSPIN